MHHKAYYARAVLHARANVDFADFKRFFDDYPALFHKNHYLSLCGSIAPSVYISHQKPD